jgi:hypothetical protein
VLIGDRDVSAGFSPARTGALTHALAPAPKTLATISGAEHIFGGISGWDTKETSDEDPARLAEIQRLTWAYLRSALYPEDGAWEVVAQDIAEREIGRIDRK